MEPHVEGREGSSEAQGTQALSPAQPSLREQGSGSFRHKGENGCPACASGAQEKEATVKHLLASLRQTFLWFWGRNEEDQRAGALPMKQFAKNIQF